MLYKENWNQIKEHYQEFWARENHDRPILSVRAPKKDQKLWTPPVFNNFRERWFNVDYMLSHAHHTFQNTYYGGDAFPQLCPDLGPDLFAALYGVPLEYGSDTSWAVHNLHEWEDGHKFRMDRMNEYYRKILELTEAAVEDGKGQYIVGVTDIHPGLDGLVSMRGPETLCIDTLECPDLIKNGAMQLFEGFKTFYDELYQMTTKYQEGSSNWMGIWHPGRWYVTSCDFCCLISTGMFEELIVEELEAELNFLDASIFHLDGPDALKHLDRLLQIDKLDGIQWVYGAGQPTAAHWIDVLKKIQEAGKCFQILATPEELPLLLKELQPEGAMYLVDAKSEDEARALEKLAGF